MAPPTAPTRGARLNGRSPTSLFRLPVTACPLLRLPAATERSIEVHHCHELVAARLGKADLGGKELLLGLEHLEVGREARGVPYIGQAHGFLVRGHGARALPLGLDELRPVREGP